MFFSCCPVVVVAIPVLFFDELLSLVNIVHININQLTIVIYTYLFFANWVQNAQLVKNNG